MNNLKELESKLESKLKEAQALTLELWKQIEALKKSAKYDFIEFVGRCGTILALKWEKLLKSYDTNNIEYSNDFRESYNEPITYTETTLDKLEKWDVFILKSEVNNIEMRDFNIFVWKDSGWDYTTQYLYNTFWIEVIASYRLYSYDEEVVKINRH